MEIIQCNISGNLIKIGNVRDMNGFESHFFYFNFWLLQELKKRIREILEIRDVNLELWLERDTQKAAFKVLVSNFESNIPFAF